MKIYLAGPLFTKAEQEFNSKLDEILRMLGYIVFLPQDECKGLDDSIDIFEKCLAGLDISNVVVAILDGSDADSGTCWEVGYAYAKNKPVFAIRTDFRQSGDTFGFNAMLFHSSSYICTGSNYLKRLKESLKTYSDQKEKATL